MPVTLNRSERELFPPSKFGLGSRAREFMLYAGASIVSLALVWFWMGLRGKSWSVLFFSALNGDTLLPATLAKSVVDNGWFLFNPSLGAPGGSALYDFNYAPTIHMAAIKGLSIVSHDFAVLLNLYLVLTFVLSTLSALYAFRRFGVDGLPALTAAVLYAFLPFHFLRGQAHLTYAAYYMLPLGGVVALWVWETDWSRRRLALATLICAVLALDVPYWPCFIAFSIGVAGVCAAAEQRSRRPLARAAGLCLVIVAAGLLNLAPSLAYQWRQGSNPAALTRFPAEAELYGLKLAQLILPIPDHRWVPLRKLRHGYDVIEPLVNENSSAALGLVGSAGFCLLLTLVFLPSAPPSSRGATTSSGGAETTTMRARWPVLMHLARLNLAAFLLATIGGFGALFAYLVLDDIRCYNRISVLVGFFALFAAAILLTEICRRAPAIAGWALCLWLIGFGTWDQTPRNLNAYALNAPQTAIDRAFAGAMEARVPLGTMIFDLPYMPYPESIAGGALYQPFKTYLYSNHFRLSFGTIKGRGEDMRQRQIAALPPAALIDVLVVRGFGGLYIVRDGYSDHARALEAALGVLLHQAPLVSADAGCAFFTLPHDRMRVERELSSGGPPAPQILSSLAGWSLGCYGVEHDPAAGDFQWCRAKARIEIDNPLDHPLRVTVQTRLALGRQTVAQCLLQEGAVHYRFTASSSGTSLAIDLTEPVGRAELRLSCDAKPLRVEGDPRTLVFRVGDLRVTPPIKAGPPELLHFKL